MYTLINNYVDLIVGRIKSNHITDYDWLMENLHKMNIGTSWHYRKRYSTFWKLSGAGLDDNFKKAYLTLLEENKSNSKIDVIEVCKFLSDLPANSTGTKKLQFSFSTKLVHMTNPVMPIYDRMVKDFFHLPQSGTNQNIRLRLNNFRTTYNFLIDEYQRIIKDGLLDNAIKIFRSQLNPKHFTDQKIIDSLIWGYVSLAKNGALLYQEIEYS